MSYTITDNSQSIERNTLQKASIFLRIFADEIVSISTPKTPMKAGNLRRDIIKSVLGLKGSIVWNKNYAIYQEEKQFKNYTTAGTGPHFAKNAVQEAIKRTTQIARQAGLL